LELFAAVLIALFFSTVVGVVFYQEIRDGLSAKSMLGIGVVILFGLAFFAHVATTFVRARKMGYYAAQFHLSSDGIERVLPEGTRLRGNWTDLDFVSPRKRLLYFRGGVVIPLMYGPRHMSQLSSEDIESVI